MYIWPESAHVVSVQCMQNVNKKPVMRSQKKTETRFYNLVKIEIEWKKIQQTNKQK